MSSPGIPPLQAKTRVTASGAVTLPTVGHQQGEVSSLERGSHAPAKEPAMKSDRQGCRIPAAKGSGKRQFLEGIGAFRGEVAAL